MGFAAEGGRDCRAAESSEWHAGLPLPGARARPTPLLRKRPPKNQVLTGGRRRQGHVSKPHGTTCISSVVLLAAFPGSRLWDRGLPARSSVGRLLRGAALSRFGLRENLNYDRVHQGLPGGSVVKHPPSAGDTVSIPGLGWSPGEENGNPLQYSCLGNAMNSGAWWATVHGFARVDTT